jgi:hypothetical protein
MGSCSSKAVGPKEPVGPPVGLPKEPGGPTIKQQPENNKSDKPILRIKIKTKIPKRLKTAVWDNYFGSNVASGMCPCCKRTSIRQVEFHCGHKISEANGGPTCLTNLIPLCAQCNLSMGRKNYDDFAKSF